MSEKTPTFKSPSSDWEKGSPILVGVYDTAAEPANRVCAYCDVLALQDVVTVVEVWHTEKMKALGGSYRSTGEVTTEVRCELYFRGVKPKAMALKLGLAEAEALGTRLLNAAAEGTASYERVAWQGWLSVVMLPAVQALYVGSWLNMPKRREMTEERHEALMAWAQKRWGQAGELALHNIGWGVRGLREARANG